MNGGVSSYEPQSGREEAHIAQNQSVFFAVDDRRENNQKAKGDFYSELPQMS